MGTFSAGTFRCIPRCSVSWVSEESKYSRELRQRAHCFRDSLSTGARRVCFENSPPGPQPLMCGWIRFVL